MEERMTYEQAIQRLEEIEKLVQDDNTRIDKLADLLREARELLKFCNEQLTGVENETRDLLRDAEGSDRSAQEEDQDVPSPF